MITHGARVTLTNEVYGTSVTGTLHAPEGVNHGHVHTLILDDGRRYRNEGKLARVTEPYEAICATESEVDVNTREKQKSRFTAPWKALQSAFHKR